MEVVPSEFCARCGALYAITVLFFLTLISGALQLMDFGAARLCHRPLHLAPCDEFTSAALGETLQSAGPSAGKAEAIG